MHVVTLHEIDVINSQPRGMLSLFAGDTGEIPNEVRTRVDERVGQWVRTGKATVVPGILFLDEVHMLDVECFAFLNRALESPLAPIVVFATNRGSVTVRGTQDVCPHGIPLDLLDRLVVVVTQLYTPNELMEIIHIRAGVEGIQLSESALLSLAEVAGATSLRFALQMLSPIAVVAQANGNGLIQKADVDLALSLFLDAKKSALNL